MLISAWVWPQLSALNLARDEPRGERADEAHDRAGEHAVGGGLQQKTRALMCQREERGSGVSVLYGADAAVARHDERLQKDHM